MQNPRLMTARKCYTLGQWFLTELDRTPRVRRRSSETCSPFLLSVILGKNGVRPKLGKLRKGSAYLQRLRTTVLGWTCKRNGKFPCCGEPVRAKLKLETNTFVVFNKKTMTKKQGNKHAIKISHPGGGQKREFFCCSRPTIMA